MKYILIFLIGLVSVSCSTVKRINDGKYFSNENFKNLSNADLSSNFKLLDTSGYESLMSNCYQRSGIVVDFGFSKIDHSRKKLIDSNYVCRFEHVKKHKYYLKSYLGDELIDSIKIRGKIKGKVFKFKPKFVFIVSTVILNAAGYSNRYIMIKENGDLYYYAEKSGMLLIVVMPVFAASDYDYFIFEKEAFQ